MAGVVTKSWFTVIGTNISFNEALFNVGRGMFSPFDINDFDSTYWEFLCQSIEVITFLLPISPEIVEKNLNKKNYNKKSAKYTNLVVQILEITFDFCRSTF